MLTVLMTNIVT